MGRRCRHGHLEQRSEPAELVVGLGEQRPQVELLEVRKSRRRLGRPLSLRPLRVGGVRVSETATRSDGRQIWLPFVFFFLCAVRAFWMAGAHCEGVQHAVELLGVGLLHRINGLLVQRAEGVPDLWAAAEPSAAEEPRSR